MLFLCKQTKHQTMGSCYNLVEKHTRDIVNVIKLGKSLCKELLEVVEVQEAGLSKFRPHSRDH